ncbi:MAG TPA: nicotinate-nucleotide adenylyltransferase [Thermoleophilaceae bacterium]|nr:nicotinate-nucleotide adenylyltransferase [Thermoleophilaceae bacterium]
MHLGILGGAFNPPHLGHLWLAQEAHARLGLNQVLLVPVGRAPHRTLAGDPGAEQRLRMVELAAEGDERLVASPIEVERPGTSYTVDTLTSLRETAPDAELTLILGADQARRLRSWQRPEDVLRLARLAVAERDGVTRDDVVAELDGLEGAESTIGFALPRIDVSSTLVRERVTAGLSIRYLVPDRVREHIAAEGLYASPAPVTTA